MFFFIYYDKKNLKIIVVHASYMTNMCWFDYRQFLFAKESTDIETSVWCFGIKTHKYKKKITTLVNMQKIVLYVSNTSTLFMKHCH